MKRPLCLLFTCLLIISLCSCSQGDSENSSSEPSAGSSSSESTADTDPLVDSTSSVSELTDSVAQASSAEGTSSSSSSLQEAQGASLPSSDGDLPSVAVEPAIPLTVNFLSEQLIKYTYTLNYSQAVYLAEIQNTSACAVSLTDATITLSDVNGNTIYTVSNVKSYPNVINPGETAYIFEPALGAKNKEFPLDQIRQAAFTYALDRADDRPSCSTELSNLIFSVDYGRPKLSGSISNTGTDDLENVCIAAPVRDSANTLQGVILIAIGELPANQTREFSQSTLFVDQNTDFTASTVDPFVFLYT